MKRVILLLVALLLIVGCSTTYDYSVDGEDVHIETDGEDEVNAVVTSDEGTSEISVTAGDEESWCQTGAEWSMTTTDSTNDGTLQMIIEGIVESGKYAGYCHVSYDIDTVESTGNIDYYFDEDGNGYQVMEIDGQSYESSWTS